MLVTGIVNFSVTKLDSKIDANSKTAEANSKLTDAKIDTNSKLTDAKIDSISNQISVAMSLFSNQIALAETRANNDAARLVLAHVSKANRVGEEDAATTSKTADSDWCLRTFHAVNDK